MSVSIIFRDDIGGYSGKGANLTPGEVDANFFNLKEAVEALQAVGFTGESIGSITVTAGQMTITGDQGTDFGTHTLPVAAFTVRGAWATATAYALNDIVLYFGAAYICAAAHTSAATFEADAGLATPRWKALSGSIRARSRTTVSVGPGSHDFAVPEGQLFAAGDRVRITNGAGDKTMAGAVGGYAPDALFDDVFWKLTVDVVAADGSGSDSDWTLINEAPVARVVVTKTGAAETLSAAEQGAVILDPAAPQTVTLPSPGFGLWYLLRNVSAGETATIDGGGALIDGVASYLLRPGFGVGLVSDGAAWRVTAMAPPATDNALLVGRADGSPIALGVPLSRLVGRKAGGDVAALTAAEALALLNGATLAANLFTGVQQLPSGSAAAPSLAAAGDVDTGVYFPAANAIGFAAAGAEQFRIAAGTGAVNRMSASGAGAGENPILLAMGADAAIGLSLTPKGTGVVHVNAGLGESFRIRSNGFWGIEANEVRRATSGGAHHSFRTDGYAGVEQFRVEHTASAVNYAQARGGAVGAPAAFAAAGADTNVDLALTPKGAGVLRFGAHTALAGESVTGYLTVKDAAGTTRKLAVVS